MAKEIENNITIKYGMLNYGTERKEAKSSFEWIYKGISHIKACYIELGLALITFSDNQYYRDFGYASLKEFLKANTDLEYTSAIRCMNVSKKFCKIVNGKRTRIIEDKYKNYDYSQLVEMCSMSDDDLKKVSSDMSVREIRAIKKKEKKEQKDNNCDVAIVKQEEIKKISSVLLDDLDENNLEYFMVDLLKLINNDCHNVLAQTSVKGKQAFFVYGGKKYKLQLCEVKK